MSSISRPSSITSISRPSSITRSSRESFTTSLETLPREHTVSSSFELNEEVLDLEDVSDDESLLDAASFPDGSFGSCVGASVGSGRTSRDTGSDCSDERAVREGSTSTLDSNSPTESELDCKIRKGLEKVKKLDGILEDTMEKEKQVKESRRALEKQFQLEVARLIEEKGEGKVCGKQQLLYLCASSDRVENIEINDVIEPIFPTQIDAEYYRDKPEDMFSPSSKKKYNGDKSSETSEGVSETTDSGKRGKNFVKRNIQLAAQAQDIVPLTDDEKQRLDELLADDSDLLMVENPFSTPAISTSGYQFSQDEQYSLQHIDEKLKELVPLDDSMSTIADSPLQHSPDNSSQFDVGDSPRSPGDLTIPAVKCGQPVLQVNYDDRACTLRLKDIEEKLARLEHMGSSGTAVDDVTSLIDPDLLRKLLEVDSRLTSDCVSICESVMSKSSLLSDSASTVGCEAGGLNVSNVQVDVPVH